MMSRIPSPKKSGVAKVPVVMQMENMECGAASLAMILAYYGKWVPLSSLRDICGVSRDGIKMSSIAKSARKLGLNAQGYRYEMEEFFQEATYPCVVHWNFTHFVVVCGHRGRHVYINDPAQGTVKITMDEFDEAFTGVCIMFSPGENFQPSGNQTSMVTYVRQTLSNAGPTMLFVTLSSLVIAFIGAVIPGFTRVFVDRILSGKSPEWLYPFLILLLILCVIQLVVGWVQAVYQMKLFGILAVKGSSRYMWHVLHMPARFFFQRQPGDLQVNEQANQTIAETFITRIVPLVIGSVMMIFYLIAMLRYSVALSCIGLFIVLINALLSRYIANRRINIMRVMRRDMSKMMSASMAGLSMIETIKVSGAENAYFGRWAGYQANVNDQNIRFEKVSQILGSIPESLVKLSSALILCGGVFLVIEGHFTAGMVLAFQGYLTAFMSPALQMITSGQMIQEMRTDMERIEDIMQYPPADTFKPDDDSEEFYRFTGDIELKGVTFGYSALEEPLIRELSISVKAGSSVAIVGSSGSGKSTILSLVSGLYKPWEGEILFDGKPLKEIPEKVFRESVSVVDQDIVLFHDTISNNICMWDPSIPETEVIQAAKDAQVHEVILKRSDGYQHVLQEGGSDFSGGERQRMEIARALVMDPSILIMDEATSALDSVTEYNVVQAIRDRNITCLIVAHRLSTIRDCDQIIVLDNGQIAEQGTHEELMEKNGLYSQLVKNN